MPRRPAKRRHAERRGAAPRGVARILAVDIGGQVFVGCYEPSRVLRIAQGGARTDIYIEDPTAHLLAHPTNLAFRGSDLFTANLGRWHITRVASDTRGAMLARL